MRTEPKANYWGVRIDAVRPRSSGNTRDVDGGSSYHARQDFLNSGVSIANDYPGSRKVLCAICEEPAVGLEDRSREGIQIITILAFEIIAVNVIYSASTRI
jgi:hypothetical protein